MTARAQEPDGYLNTYFTLTCPDRKFANLPEGCELYCAGHLMKGAAALYEATGNRKLLDVMCKNADLFYRHFITQSAEGYPGHPEVELGLIRLWQATGEPRYRQLADAGHLQYTKAAAKPSLLLRQLFVAGIAFSGRFFLLFRRPPGIINKTYTKNTVRRLS